MKAEGGFLVWHGYEEKEGIDLVELLAPAGSEEALTAAVESGADAVYLAGKAFGARAYAANFDEAAMAEAIAFAHRRNVAVHVTVNTLVDESECAQLASYLRFLYEAGADAAIVQDLGAAEIARRVAPDLPLHASTQLSVHSLEGVRFLGEQGFSRVVLARELSLEEIRSICAQTAIEIEVFAHGALCVCYSGQCLMSSLIGGRSGNRGRCAQPCRLPYALVDESGADLLAGADAGAYLLSPRDLNTLEVLPQLIEAGVASFKIEGRMKRPEYVAVVTDVYRRAIDAHLSGQTPPGAEDRRDLAQIFNRDFTTAYLEKRQGRNMMSDRRPNNRGLLAGRVTRFDAQRGLAAVKLAQPLAKGDVLDFWVKVGGRVNATVAELFVHGKSVEQAAPGEEVSLRIGGKVRPGDRVFKVFDTKLMARARSFFQGGAARRRIAVDAFVSAAVGAPLRIRLADAEGFCGEGATDFVGETAARRPLTEETVRKQLERLGTTVFALRQLACEIEGEVMVPVSEINEARRRAVESLEARRLARYARPRLQEAALPAKRRAPLRPAQPELVVRVDTVAKAEAALRGGADIVLFGGDAFAPAAPGLEEYREAYALARAAGARFALDTPRMLRGAQAPDLERLLEGCRDMELAGVAVHHAAAIPLVRRALDAPLHADAALNVYNSYAIDFLARLGAASVTLSPELNFGQIEALAARSALPVECIVHGNLELMLSEYCAIGSFLGGLDGERCARPCKARQYFLKDRKDERFPLATDQFCRMHVLNGKTLEMLPYLERFARIGVKRLRIEAKYMPQGSLEGLVRRYKTRLAAGEATQALPENEGQNVTRGHYFRGVL